MTIEWLKLFHHLPEDRKISSFSINQKWAWICILCAASQSENRGIVLDDPDDLSTYCGFNNLQDYQFFLDKLRQKGMIEPVPGGFRVTQWEKRQQKKPSDSPEQTKERKRRQRAKEKPPAPQDVTPMSRDVTPLSRGSHAIDLDQDLDQEQELESIALLDPERNATQRNTREFQNLTEQPTAAEQKLNLPSRNNTATLERNSEIEISNFPPVICAEDRQQPALNTSLVQSPQNDIKPLSRAAQRAQTITEAINIYNEFRGNWGECHGLSGSQRSRLEGMLINMSANDFLAMVKDSTLCAASDTWLNKPEFDNKNFGFLIGKHGSDRLAEYALKWRSLPESSKVGAALKSNDKKNDINYHDLQGNPTTKTWASGIWWDISKKAMNGEIVSKLEQDWCKYYFPKYDIYVGDEWLA